MADDKDRSDRFIYDNPSQLIVDNSRVKNGKLVAQTPEEVHIFLNGEPEDKEGEKKP